MSLNRFGASWGATSFIGSSFVLIALPQTALARDPVSQCTGPSQALSAPSAMAAPSSMTSDSGIPDGRVVPQEPGLAALKPKVSTQPNVGEVNLKSGAFTYSNEDISVGQGEFPSRLHLVRSYDSSRDVQGEDGITWPRFGPGAPDILSFGIGSTHNLDIRYRAGHQVFGNDIYVAAYEMIYITVGFQALEFQKCANGEFVSSNRDGNRLFPDTTYLNGYRLELADGTKIFFQSFGNKCYPIGAAEQDCGHVRRWESPNGDWANFEYEQYYDKPDRAINQHLNTDNRIDTYSTVTPYCINTASVTNDCREVSTSYFQFYDSLVEREYRANEALYNLRLISVSTNRNYRFDLTYIDPTANIGTVCYHGSTFGSMDCLPPANNAQQRSLVSTVKAYSGTTLVREVSYEFSGHYLFKFYAPDARVTKYERTFASGPTANMLTSLKIFQPGDHTTPVTTVSFTSQKAGLFPGLPINLWQSGLAELTYLYYPRVTSQSFADGTSVQYNATISSKWMTSSAKDDYISTGVSTFWKPVDYISRMDIVEPGNVVTVNIFDNEDAPVQITDALNNVTSYTYSEVGSLLSTTMPEGDKIVYNYDVRGNVIQETRYPKPGSSLAVTSETATYVGGPTLPANSCGNQKTCNKLLTHTDARAAVTDYSWDSSGMLTSITGPADANGVRPITTYTYTDYSGFVSGAVRLLSSKTEKVNATQSSVTSFGYDGYGFPREIVNDVGGLNLRTCLRFDAAGLPVSQAAPNANLTSCP